MSKTKRRPLRDIQILEMLKEAAHYEESPFWKQVLLDAGDGVFPTNRYSLYSGVLKHGRGASRSSLVISGDDPEEVARKFIGFLEETGTINREEVELDREELGDVAWESLRTAPLRVALLEKFLETNLEPEDRDVAFNYLLLHRKRFEFVVKDGEIDKVIPGKGLTGDKQTWLQEGIPESLVNILQASQDSM